MVFPEVAKHFQAFLEREESDFSKAPSIEILDVLDEFWSLSIGPLGSPNNPTVYVAYSDACRTPIPIHIGQAFQFKSDTGSD